MKMKVFLDTNILLEVVMNREKKKSCQQILQAGLEGDISTCASFLSFANIAYILQKQKFPRHDIYSIERDFESIVDVLYMDGGQLRASLQREVQDFEDMLQYQCAAFNGCDSIVTINTKHFLPFSSLPVFTPDVFMTQLKSKF